MSKSLGNAARRRGRCSAVRPVELRYYLAAAHYRSTWSTRRRRVAEARRRLPADRGVRDARGRAGRRGSRPARAAGRVRGGDGRRPRCPRRWRSLHDAVREGNRALATRRPGVRWRALGEVRAMLGVLGARPARAPWAGRASAATGAAGRRARRRRPGAAAEAAGAQGLRRGGRGPRPAGQRPASSIEDTPAGPRWALEGPPDGRQLTAARRRRNDREQEGRGRRLRRASSGARWRAAGPTPPAELRGRATRPRAGPRRRAHAASKPVARAGAARRRGGGGWRRPQHGGRGAAGADPATALYVAAAGSTRTTRPRGGAASARTGASRCWRSAAPSSTG